MTLEDEAVRAPELRGSVWYNTDRPLTLSDLRGKLVLLDFWTYCCINCLHVLEDLKAIERQFADEPFVVVGVHSPKFTHEDDPENVRAAILRYGITHPVLLDSGRRTWDAYAVRGWPTLVLVDPRGYILGRVSGEGHGTRLAGAIATALDLLRQADALDNRPLPLRLEAETGALDAASPLLYPGKVLADAASETLWVADTGHHRLVRSTLDGANPSEIGEGEPGWVDGPPERARFRSPQGLALDRDRDCLYVADTGNHLLRRVDVASGEVTTIAGTGVEGLRRSPDGPARETPLNSPWDLCLLDGTVYVAMAGWHQLWTYDPAAERMAWFAGNGAEGRADGAASRAAFAQPSGLATDGHTLFVADSESSCVRAITVDHPGEPLVRTLAGGDLFLFGDRDGVGDEARMQHPLGLTWVPLAGWNDGALVVADTYNSRLRWLDLASNHLGTYAGDAAPGHIDARLLTARFAEPSGVSYAAGRFYIADTNHNAVRVLTEATGQVITLRLRGLCAPGLCLPG